MLGLLSNAEEREVRSWPQSPLAPFFNSASFSFETGKLKPELSAYHAVLRGLGADAASCAFVGDGGARELVGARSAGFGRIVFMRAFVSKDGLCTQKELEEYAAQSDEVTDNFSELSLRLTGRFF